MPCPGARTTLKTHEQDDITDEQVKQVGAYVETAAASSGKPKV